MEDGAVGLFYKYQRRESEKIFFNMTKNRINIYSSYRGIQVLDDLVL